MMKLRFSTALYVITAGWAEFSSRRHAGFWFCALWQANPIVVDLAGYDRHNEWMLESTAPKIFLAYFLIMNYKFAFNKDRNECFQIN